MLDNFKKRVCACCEASGDPFEPTLVKGKKTLPPMDFDPLFPPPLPPRVPPPPLPRDPRSLAVHVRVQCGGSSASSRGVTADLEDEMV